MTGLENYLNEVDGQEAQEEKQIQVFEDPLLKYLIEEYEYWLRYQYTTCYVNKYKDLGHTSKQINEFLVLIKKCENLRNFQCSGSFVSFLINDCKENSFEVITRHLAVPLDLLCSHNYDKEIIVRGNAGIQFGSDNRGKLIIEGNTGDWTGSLQCGEITVNGSVGNNTGAYMCPRGIVNVNGSIAGFDRRCTGKIYQNGKLVKGSLMDYFQYYKNKLLRK